MTTTTTPALELAAALHAIAEHLAKNPNLTAVNITRPVAGFDTVRLQIAGYKHFGEPDGMPALLAWAKSLDSCEIRLGKHKDNETSVWVDGVIDGVTVKIWDVDEGDLYRWRGSERNTPITLEQLADYVAAGTVDGLGAA